MPVIKLPVYGIVITIDEQDGKDDICCDLLQDSNGPEYAAALDGALSVVFAHALAGFDVETPAYWEGLETALASVIHRHEGY